MTNGWACKVGPESYKGHLRGRVYGKAHYLEGGRPICAGLVFRDGPALSKFTCTWTSYDGIAKKCALCVRMRSRPSVRIGKHTLELVEDGGES